MYYDNDDLIEDFTRAVVSRVAKRYGRDYDDGLIGDTLHAMPEAECLSEGECEEVCHAAAVRLDRRFHQ